MKNSKKITKISTITKRANERNLVLFNRLQNKTLRKIVASDIRMNVSVKISPKPF